MTNWEYMIITAENTDRIIKVENFETQINQMAEHGWEPVNITAESAHQKRPRLHCLLKRQNKP